MTITALLLIVGTNIIVGVIQLIIFTRVARAADELHDIAAQYLTRIVEIALNSISEAGVRVNKLLDVLETFNDN